jgi:hypothetical protein
MFSLIYNAHIRTENVPNVISAQDFVRHQAQTFEMTQGTIKEQEMESLGAICRRVSLTSLFHAINSHSIVWHRRKRNSNG